MWALAESCSSLPRFPEWTSWAFACIPVDADDLGVAHLPPPVAIDDVLELGHGPIPLLRLVDLVETGPDSPLGAQVKVALAPMVVR